jgi:hypothetical protein
LSSNTIFYNLGREGALWEKFTHRGSNTFGI